jgi:hypothetical protein
MKYRFGLMLILLALLFPGVTTTHAQANQPAIVTFTSSVEAITLDEALSGTTMTTLEWHTVGMTADYHLRLHIYHLSEWELVFDPDAVPLEANGSRQTLIRHPENFGPPTFLLSIVDSRSRIIDQRPLVIPYETPTEDTTIDNFSTDATQVDAGELSQGTARVSVVWIVTNRPPTANLYFEQILADGNAVPVELPRPYAWIMSNGAGPVAPVYQVGITSVRLRLQVRDVIDNTVYAEEEITLPVVGTPLQPPPTAMPAYPTAALQPGSSAEIASFTAYPTTVNRSGAVTLTWSLRGTGGVVIEESIPNVTGAVAVVNADSPQGTTTVYTPDYAAYTIQYTLWTANRSDSASVTVNIHCPYTFFFGETDACPQNPATTVSAAYQRFEGGTMIWRSDTGEVIVLFEDGGFQTGQEVHYPPENYSGQPDPLPSEMPPLDRVIPSSGFGKVWANFPGVRDRLGWALAPEQPYTAQAQSVAIYRDPQPAFATYLTLPDGHIVGLGFGTWQIIQ